MRIESHRSVIYLLTLVVTAFASGCHHNIPAEAPFVENHERRTTPNKILSASVGDIVFSSQRFAHQFEGVATGVFGGSLRYVLNNALVHRLHSDSGDVAVVRDRYLTQIWSRPPMLVDYPLYLSDTNGDDKFDTYELLPTGSAPKSGEIRPPIKINWNVSPSRSKASKVEIQLLAVNEAALVFKKMEFEGLSNSLTRTTTQSFKYDASEKLEFDGFSIVIHDIYEDRVLYMVKYDD